MRRHGYLVFFFLFFSFLFSFFFFLVFFYKILVLFVFSFWGSGWGRPRHLLFRRGGSVINLEGGGGWVVRPADVLDAAGTHGGSPCGSGITRKKKAN